MLIERNKNNEFCVDYIDWCEDVINALSVDKNDYSLSLSKQQKDLLNNLKNNKCNIIKAYRQAGTTTLMLLKIAYDITHQEKDVNQVLFISHSHGCLRNNRDLLMKILEKCHEIIEYEKINGKTLNVLCHNKKTRIYFSTLFDSWFPGIGIDEMYVDNAAFLDKKYDFNITGKIKELLKADKRITIGSCPNSKSGFFYDLWNKVVDGDIDYIDFNPICLKWYLDSRFNSEIQMTKNGYTREIKNIGMLCEAIETNTYLSNRWVHMLASMLSRTQLDTEINGKFY